MKILKTSIISLLILTSVYAQKYTASLNQRSSFSGNPTTMTIDTVRILAVMVEFQPDNDNTTVGNGTFNSIYSQDYGTSIVDPLPHNKDYFLAHLEFVKNYYKKVSNGKQVIIFEVLPNSVTLSKTMRNYSPPIKSTDFTVMGDFIQETWKLADSANPGFNFSSYNLFFIFHAGVGRDISLPGSLGNERDLPSIYFNLKSLQKFYENNYQGVPVSGGSFFIQNSGVLPQTQSREVTSFNSKFLYQITTNGLLVSTVAGYLGLPDLFDTETGLSAIGRFGLMDGQSIFAYNGAFPPEPSPWEKMKLGWVTPIEISGSVNDLSLLIKTKNISTAIDTSLVMLRINANEYFLIENRQRDAFKDGAKLTLKNGSNIVNRTYLKDTTGFSSFSIDSLKGVLIDVDEFDWALPGSGVLVWHIDEKVINEKIADNKVNTNKKRRGVAVVEADGINDIGEKFYTIFGDEVIGEGTEFDFWFLENKADLYKNIFSNTSRPNTKSNDGGNSLITMKNFPALQNEMRFSLAVSDSLIKPYLNGKFPVGVKPSQIVISENSKYLLSNRDLFSFDNNFIPTIIAPLFSNSKVAFSISGTTQFLVGKVGTSLNLAKIVNGVSTLNSIALSKKITTTPIITSNLSESSRIVVGTENGTVYRFSMEPFALLDSVVSSEVDSVSYIYNENSVTNFVQIKNENNYTISNFTGGSLKVQGKFLEAQLLNQNGALTLAVLESSNKLKLFSCNSTPVLNKEVTLPASGLITSISASDNKLDGNLYLNYTASKELLSVNLQGANADNFPMEIKISDTLAGKVVAADFIGTPNPELIGCTKNGLIYAFDGKSGKLVDGFPISIGEELASAPTFLLNNGKIVLLTIGKSDFISSWELNLSGGKIFYSGNFANYENTNSVKLVYTTPVVNEFFPQTKVYNYPNPVTGSETFIRYFVGEDSDILVKIFDLSGDFVAELKGYGHGGMDGEIAWQVGDIQSGVYLARVEAKSISSGKSDSKIIKIAIIK
jgi:hypothetical protein